MADTFRLNSIPTWMLDEKTCQVFDALQLDGFDAPRLVGGCVRDSIINRQVFDIDIATPLPPQKVIELLQKAKIKAIPTGIEHGTVTAVIDKTPFEITTLRKDIETDGRHAKVEFTDDWEEDATRRDFTINAMSCDKDGNIFDYCGGVKDLHAGIIKFIGHAEDRISEDYLRILRFFRFYAYFGRGNTDAKALKACSKFASKISTLSKERITSEFLKMLVAKNVGEACKYMLESGVMEQIISEGNIERLENMIALEKYFYSNEDGIRRLVSLSKIEPRLFCLSKAQKKQRKILSEAELINPDVSKEDLRLKIYDFGHDIVRDFILLSASENMVEKETYKDHYQFVTACRLPKFQIIGGDVLSLGLSEGKDIGSALKSVEKWWKQRDFVPGRTECLTYLQGVVRAIKEKA